MTSRRRNARKSVVRPGKRRAGLWASLIDGPHGVSVTPADADGVDVEWVETVPASCGQPTIVLFHRSRSFGFPLEAVRPLAARLAMVTTARVLSVACRSTADAVTAYAWLLGEGLDLETTSFVGGPADGGLPAAVGLAANEIGLPTPADACRHQGDWRGSGKRPTVLEPFCR